MFNSFLRFWEKFFGPQIGVFGAGFGSREGAGGIFCADFEIAVPDRQWVDRVAKTASVLETSGLVWG